MPVKAITPDYRSEVRDNRERFGPNQLLNI